MVVAWIVVSIYLVIIVLLGSILYATRPATWLRDTLLLMLTPLAVPVAYVAVRWLGT